MALSSDLIRRFVTATKDRDESKKETTVYGTIVESDGSQYVKLDGSELLTPISKTSDARDGDRVTVLIKNHTAIVTGNLTSPSARIIDVEVIGDDVSAFNTILADKVDTIVFEAEKARIDSLTAANVTITNTLTAHKADIDTLTATKLDAHTASLTYATIDNLNATNVEIDNLQADYGDFQVLTAERLEAVEATVRSFDASYANIDFTNIGKAAMEYFYAQSGLIDNVVVGDQTITGELVGVTINGDRLIGNTVIAEKLVIKGSDGLYYKLNTDGMKVEAQQTDQNSINGQVIKAKSITATKISVSDLVAFGATIGGFTITQNSLYSGAKSAVGNTTRGIFLGNDGQVAIGDASNFLKYYKDTDGTYKLAISAKSLEISSGVDVETAIANVQSSVDSIEVGGRNLVLGSDVEVSFKNKVQTFPLSVYGIQNIKNRQVTVSFDACTDEVGTGIDFYLRTAVIDGTGQNASNIVPVSNLTKGYVRYSGVVTSTGLDAIALAVRSTTAATGTTHSATATIYVKNIKVEFGNRPTDWTAAPEDLDVGSRNYVLHGDTEQRITTSYYKLYDISPVITNLRSSRAVVSFDAKKASGSSSVNMYAYLRGSDGVVVQSEKIGDITDEYARYVCYIVCPSDLSAATHVAINTNVNTGDVYIKNVKLERGTNATDWTPAPEDVASDITEAAKTAKNYMYWDSTNGLQVGNRSSGSWSGFRTQITNAAFNILNAAGTTLASYGEKLIELGKNATDAVIKFCGGKGRIEYAEDYLQLAADSVRLKGVEMASLYSNYTDSNGVFRNGAVHAAPADVSMTAGGGSDNSSVHVKPTNIQMTTDNFYLTGVMNDSGNGGTYVSVTKGTSGIWTYKKYANGDLEMWCSYAISNMECTNAMGSLYRTAVFSPTAFPFTVYNPVVTASYESEGYGAFLWATTKATTAKPPNYYLVRSTSATIASGVINFHVFGKWKT